jgi:hypothetical protein
VFHHLGPLWDLHTPITKASGHHTGGHIVELDDGGMNGGSEMLIALLVPLGQNGPEAVVGHHLLEQFLGRGSNQSYTEQAFRPRLKPV